MKSIVDFVLTNNLVGYEEVKVNNSVFVYNSYDESESIQKDDVILEEVPTGNIKKRFIRLTFSDETVKNVNYSDNSFLQEIYDLSRKASLSVTDMRFFNSMSSINNNRLNYVYSEDSGEVGLYNEYFGSESDVLENSSYSSILNDFRFKRKFSIGLKNEVRPKRKLSGDIISADSFNYFEDALIDPQVNVESIYSGNLFSNMNILCSKVNESTPISFSQKNAIKCGIVLEKFTVGNGGTIEFLAGKFYSLSEEQLNGESPKFRQVVEDTGVVYGKTYIYTLRSVYLHTKVDPKNRFMLQHFLLCSAPYITRRIDCRESISPPPPNNIRFLYNKRNKGLIIDWDEPTDYQDDAKGYQILKRTSLENPFEIIAQLEGHSDNDFYFPVERVESSRIIRTPGEVNYRYFDKTYVPGEVTIYAIRTIDAHGYFSDYSHQIALLWDPFEEKLIHDLVSEKGAKRDNPNEKLNRSSIFFKNDANIIENNIFCKGAEKISLYLTPDFKKLKEAESGDLVIKTLGDEYKFTIFKVNDSIKHEDSFQIKNFYND